MSAGTVMNLSLYHGRSLLWLILACWGQNKDPKVWHDCNGWNAGGVWNTDRDHCTPIYWSFLAYKAAMHDGGFVRAWNCASMLQNCPFAWRHVEYCCSVIMTACDSSYGTSIHLLSILYWTYTLPCGTGRLKILYIWSCCALFCVGTSMRSTNCPLLLPHVFWGTSINVVCHLMIWAGTLLKVPEIWCNWAYFLSSSTGSIYGDSMLVVAAST